MPLDANKDLRAFHAEWEECTRCELGVRRRDYGGAYVAGRGARRGIMVIGDGVNAVEEAEEKPLVGYDDLLRDIFAKLYIEDVCYLTNLTPCRSCKAEFSTEGKPLMCRNSEGILIPRFKDQTPLTSQLNQCRPHLYEEIYLVDPLIIVLLGPAVAAAVTRQNTGCSVGTETTVSIPSILPRASITEKGSWMRKHKGLLSYPVQEGTVSYLGIVTYAPAYAIRSKYDQSDKNAIRQMARHFQSVKQTYLQLAPLYGLEVDVKTDAAAESKLVSDA